MRYNLHVRLGGTRNALVRRLPYTFTDNGYGQAMHEIISRQEALARGLKAYFTGKPCVNGHTEPRSTKTKKCPKCGGEYRAKWKLENRERLNEFRRRSRSKNPELKAAERARAAERAGRAYTPMPRKRGKSTANGPVLEPESVSIEGARWFLRPCGELEKAHMERSAAAARDAWRHLINVRASDEWASLYFELRGDPWNNPRLSDAEQYRLKYALDVEFNISERVRRQLRKKQKRDGIATSMRDAIKRGGESRVVKEAFGYTIAQLKCHLESGFHNGMDWPAFMRGEIHIDHIKPQSAFDMSEDEQYKACWALENLRPLWAEDNLAKSDLMPCGNRGRDMRKAA